MIRPTQAFRDEHRKLHEHLEHVRAWTGEIDSLPADRQRQVGSQIVGFFEHHIAPHAAWEERALYPVVDRHAGSAEAHLFTASMRHEHRIVERWVAELRAHLAAAEWTAFRRRTDQLIGLVEAHFEVEEEVLLPVLDVHLTAEDFDAEVGLVTH